MTAEICIRCRSPTTKRCTGCMGAPSYDREPSVSMFYCSSECQKADWPRHKPECRKLQARKSLSRAASLLQAIMYKIRSHATTLEITSVHVEGTTIYLNGPLPNPFCTQLLKPFPVHLFEDRAILESALVYTACTEAMVFLYSFARELLQDICSEINEVAVSLIEHRLRICFGPAQGPKVNTPQSMYHNVYRVVLKQGEAWAIDTTGAQFGYYDPLSSWQSFRQRISKVDRVTELGYIRHRVFYKSSNNSVKSIVSQQAEKEDLAKLLDHWLLVWVKPYSGKFSAILQGPERAFQSTKHEFLEQLTVHIKKSLARMHVPAEIMRRTKEIEEQVAQSQADPTRRNDFEGFLKFFASAMGKPSP